MRCQPLVDEGVVRRQQLDRASVFAEDALKEELGLTAEIAAMIAWLASEECSFSTGAVFDLSGGRAVY